MLVINSKIFKDLGALATETGLEDKAKAFRRLAKTKFLEIGDENVL